MKIKVYGMDYGLTGLAMRVTIVLGSAALLLRYLPEFIFWVMLNI